LIKILRKVDDFYMTIITYNIEDFFKNGLDRRPFTGIRELGEKTNVICKGKNMSDSWFSPSSMLGTSREIYYSNLKEWGLTPEKEYTIIRIEGHGDVFDVCIKENDTGTEQWYMSMFFEIKNRDKSNNVSAKKVIDKNIKKCPSCGSEEYYIKQSFTGTCNFRLRFDGKETDNGDMHDNTQYKNTSKYAYCNDCNKKLFELEE
jgi:hypothetical protein